MSDIKKLVVSKGVALVVGIIILLVAHQIGVYVKGLIFSRGRTNLVTTSTNSQEINMSKDDQTKQLNHVRLAYVIVGNLAYYGVMIVALMTVLKLFGIESTSLVAMLGATGFTLGLALQGTFSDVSSGIIMGFMQTYSIGDLIEVDGHKGYVAEFTLTRTVVKDVQTGAVIIIPNRSLSDKTVVNHTRMPVKKVITYVSIANYFKDFEGLVSLLQTEVAKHPNVVNKEGTVVEVEAMDINATKMKIHYYVNSDMYPMNVGPVQTLIRQTLADNNIPLEGRTQISRMT